MAKKKNKFFRYWGRGLRFLAIGALGSFVWWLVFKAIDLLFPDTTSNIGLIVSLVVAFVMIALVGYIATEYKNWIYK